MSKLSKEQHQEIIKLYDAGETPTNIGLKYGIYPQTVNKIYKKYGGIANQAAPRVTQLQKDKIIKDYQAGASAEKLAKELNIAGTTVCRILENHGITQRTADERTRTYAINKHYFDVIDTQDKAYFLGLLYADGCVYKDGSSEVKIVLQKDDTELLKKLSILLYDKEHITLNDDTTVLYIYCKHINETLTKHGCTPLKTFTIRFPTWLDDNLIPHFIRGYLDGDGCIYTSKDRFKVSFTSNAMFIQDLCDILKNKLNIKSSAYSIGENKNIFTKQLELTDNIEKLNFLNLIYKDANIYMQRKYDKYQWILNNLESIAPRLYKELNK